KAPQSLWQRDRALDVVEAAKTVRRALADSRGQLSADRPGILALAGFHLSPETFDILRDGAEIVLQKLDQPHPYLLGIALHNLSTVAGVEKAGVASIWLEQRSRLGRNRQYQGRTQLVGDWGGAW